MSWFHPYENVANDGYASVSEVLACFRQERKVLLRFAFLITADNTAAEQSLENACEMTVKGHGPSREWLSQWVRVATITTAISHCIGAIRQCEAMYNDQHCTHAEHRSQADDAEREHRLNAVVATDPQVVITQLDPLSRAVLLLRLAIGWSIQDCVLRLNVSRPAVLAANCAAMTWLHDLQLKQADSRKCPAEQQTEKA
jgi:DNA-directed RNA polymerase specialized sigma24 family protein